MWHRHRHEWRVRGRPRLRAVVVDEAGLTPEEIDAEFERTAYIGDAINALAQAEDVVAAVDELPPEVEARLDRILRNALGQASD